MPTPRLMHITYTSLCANKLMIAPTKFLCLSKRCNTKAKCQPSLLPSMAFINATVKAVIEDALANQEKGLFFAMQVVLEKNIIKVNGKPVALRPVCK